MAYSFVGEFSEMTEERKTLSGVSCPDDLALWVGRFIMYFGYLEFHLWLWYNEIHDSKLKAEEFYGKQLSGRVGSIKDGTDRMTLSKDDRKELKSLLDRFLLLAESRNLVCHNPYITIGGRENEVKNGRIFGLRMATINDTDPIPEASIADVEGFARTAFTLCGDFHRLFGIFQAGLPAAPRK